MTDSTRTRQYGAENTPVSSEEALALEPASYVGRYRIERLLGKGSFGVVCLARDEQLDRPVAIKVTYRTLIPSVEDAESHLAEARTVAQLDHPNIVPIYDVGSSETCPCYIVTKYIEGQTLADKVKTAPPSLVETVELVIALADALHFAHGKGIVHRDVKPSNILLDRDNKPYLADFGLALKEEKFGEGPRFAGTAAYMSPEQARGEGHRVDGRSDVFSLGVIFYELLTGRRPFKGESRDELREQIAVVEPRPPRQFMDSLPRELERICLKALAKRASERYLTARDMADDLQLFLVETGNVHVAFPSATSGLSTVSLSGEHRALPDRSGTTGPSHGSGLPSTGLNEPVRIVPKGLRSFDAHDADFYLELVPGPRDRTGLPDSIRFWKTFIEERDADNTSPVGLLYGPSGCGKSSLVKAGLLPRLSESVVTVYLEATAEETETRLQNGLRKRCPALANLPTLKETLAALRQGQGVPPHKKVLIVLDQFEQWLHARRGEQGTELVQALRQCDGGRVQCLVLVRDDFWMTATRFMRELEIPLLEGQNSAAIDLFDVDHARRVLAAFGRAFGRLPSETLSKDHKEFLRQAVADLTQEGKIVCVRLTLFAEMMKGKPWTPASLRAVGGTEGVGATFLEETFSAATAPPEHRLHQQAARTVLQALLPESGTSIKGNMRSHDELLEASGYAGRPRDFEELMRILDSEVRLITPTDPEGEAVAGETSSPVPVRRKYYQLTHDYLVHSLRIWLTRKQKETRRGRAELLLADLTSVWNARPENRQLPSLPQWLSIRSLTYGKDWSAAQRRMMWQADRYHAIRTVLVLGLLVVLGIFAVLVHREITERNKAQLAEELVKRLRDADISQVPVIIEDLKEYRKWTDPLLKKENETAKLDSRQKLHTSLALLPVDPKQLPYLQGRLLDVKTQPREIHVLREALKPHRDMMRDGLWTVAEQPPEGQKHQRLRAACALAWLDPDSPRWSRICEAIGDDLVAVDVVHLALWVDSLRPVSPALLTPLGAIFRDSQRRDIERTMATEILSDYTTDQPSIFAGLLLDADKKQFRALDPKLKDHGRPAIALLLEELNRSMPSEGDKDTRDRLAQRQANAAAALLPLGESAKIWPMLELSPDPRRRSFLIHRLTWLAGNAEPVFERLEKEQDLTAQRALVLILGEFDEKALTVDRRAKVTAKLQEMYRTHPDPGMHAAAEWVLRRWRHSNSTWIKDRLDEWSADKRKREARLEEIRRELKQKNDPASPRWYVNSQSQTMVVLPGPMKGHMGSPPGEPGRSPLEKRHWRKIERTFAISATSVTVEQFQRFKKDENFMRGENISADSPCVGVSFFEAARYCNWLSKQEGLPPSEWCYVPDEMKGYGDGMRLAKNYLSRRGYRLPTEAEWEYAVRAGSITSRPYGDSELLLGKYAWYKNSSSDHTWPVGRLKPNDLGLFDALGNVWNLCQNRPREYFPGAAVEEVEDTEEKDLIVRSDGGWVVRGGSYARPAEKIRSGERGDFAAGSIASDIGFRVAHSFR